VHSFINSSTDADVEEIISGEEIVPRRIGEVIGSTIGTLASAVSYPFGNNICVDELSMI